MSWKITRSYCISNNSLSSVSPGLNEVRGAHDDEQQKARPGARREAIHNTLILNKRQTTRAVA